MGRRNSRRRRRQSDRAGKLVISRPAKKTKPTANSQNNCGRQKRFSQESSSTLVKERAGGEGSTGTGGVARRQSILLEHSSGCERRIIKMSSRENDFHGYCRPYGEGCTRERRNTALGRISSQLHFKPPNRRRERNAFRYCCSRRRPSSQPERKFVGRQVNEGSPDTSTHNANDQTVHFYYYYTLATTTTTRARSENGFSVKRVLELKGERNLCDFCFHERKT